MTAITSDTRAVLLYAALPEVDAAWLRVRLNARLSGLGFDFSLHESQNEYGPMLSGGGIDLQFQLNPEPLGAENFVGAIGAGATPATRAGLIGIVGRHMAHVILTARQTGDNGDKPTQRQIQTRLRLTHLAAAALARTAPPQALYWGPTNRLHHAASMASHFESDLPLELFVDFRDRAQGKRRHPGLHVIGAEVWLGKALAIWINTGAREAAKPAALGFLQAALSSGRIAAGQSYYHEGQPYRIGHAGEGSQLCLIPTLETMQPARGDAAYPLSLGT